MLKIGQIAPDFTLPDQDGNLRSLRDFRGQKVVLYFYPKDNTPGCTAQACGFAQLYPQFSEQGAVIIGISKDSVKSHKNFANKYKLPFILLADPQREVLARYEVLKPKKMYGKEVIGTIRTTLLLDEEGKIVKLASDVNAQENPQDSLDALQIKE